MRSLFFKIFLSFWTAQALIVALAILVTAAMRPARQISSVEALQPKFLSEAIQAYQTGGAEQAHNYLRSLHETQHVHAVLFRDGENIMGHSVPPWFVEVAKGQRRPANTLLGRLNPHFQVLRAAMDGPDGHHYVLVTELPPGQNALFGPNGLPGLGLFIAIVFK